MGPRVDSAASAKRLESEHGLGKICYLTDELGEAVDIMRSIKTALDPDGLMNPGKIFASGATI